MSSFIKSLQNGINLLRRRDDDMYDRLSNRYSIGIFVMCAMALTTKTYVGDPIDCFTPAEFNGQWVKFTDNYCFVKNTYYLPLDTDVVETLNDEEAKAIKRQKELQFYQWVPIILAFQIFLFAVPSFIWQWAAASSGYDVENVVKATAGTDSLNPDKRDKTYVYLINQIDRHLGYLSSKPVSKLSKGKGKTLALGSTYGRYLMIWYLVVKVLYIINAVAQFFILNGIIHTDYSMYGYQALSDFLTKKDWTASPLFPRITWCDFSVRRMGENHHPYTVQCLLNVNLFNEKVFIFIWWWLAFVASLSIVGLILWMMRTLAPGAKRAYVRKYLRIMQRLKNDKDEQAASEFADNYLKDDGVFMMRLITKNTNDAIGGEIMAALYDKWCEEHYDKVVLPTSGSPLIGRRASSGSDNNYTP